MLQDTQSRSPSESPKIFLPKPTGSGLTLVIPSLKSLKASQIATKKAKPLPTSISQSTSTYQDVDPQEKKPLRPVKLKPLKEVLSRLIAQIKRFDIFSAMRRVTETHLSNRKDDYAFFLKPVNTANVPGYTDLIKIPMDFGTMTHKVNRGKYRSLDDFTVGRRPIFQQIFDWSSFIPVRFQAGDKQRQGIQSTWFNILRRSRQNRGLGFRPHQ